MRSVWIGQWEWRMWFEIRGGWTAVPSTHRHGCQIGKKLNNIWIFSVEMRANVSVDDGYSVKLSGLPRSVGFVAIWCIFCGFSDRFCVRCEFRLAVSLLPSLYIYSSNTRDIKPSAIVSNGYKTHGNITTKSSTHLVEVSKVYFTN